MLQPLERLLGRFAQQEPDEPAIGSGDWETREVLASHSLDEIADPGAWPDGARRFRHRDSDRKIVVAPERSPPEPADHDAAHARTDVPRCRLDESLQTVQRRVSDAGWETCFVVDAGGVVIGRLGRRALGSDDDLAVAVAMTEAPSTVRPSARLGDLVERMRRQNLSSLPVTTSDGRLVGLLLRETAEEALQRLQQLRR